MIMTRHLFILLLPFLTGTGTGTVAWTPCECGPGCPQAHLPPGRTGECCLLKTHCDAAIPSATACKEQSGEVRFLCAIVVCATAESVPHCLRVCFDLSHTHASIVSPVVHAEATATTTDTVADLPVQPSTIPPVPAEKQHWV